MSVGSSDAAVMPHQSPWVLVAGGFHHKGGMDKANLALAQHLAELGTPVHIVCHGIDAQLAAHSQVTVHMVRRPAGSFFLGRPMLDRRGRQVARKITNLWPGAQVLVNGDNCLWPGINWVHYVHSSWRNESPDGPLWYRVKQRIDTVLCRKRERSAAGIGRVFITNSDRTSRDMIERLNVPPERVHTVYLGAESEWGPITGAEKAASREHLGIRGSRPVAVFVGALGFDHRKGFDTLFGAWRTLCTNPDWDVDLLVAGTGSALSMWKSRISESGLSGRVRMLGFTNRVRDLLAAADLLVSPARYEAYGLNVQEAICRGVPAIVSRDAGVAERYPEECTPLLLRDPGDQHELVTTLRLWRSDRDAWKARFQEFGGELREYGWSDMARRIVSLATDPPGANL